MHIYIWVLNIPNNTQTCKLIITGKPPQSITKTTLSKFDMPITQSIPYVEACQCIASTTHMHIDPTLLYWKLPLHWKRRRL